MAVAAIHGVITLRGLEDDARASLQAAARATGDRIRGQLALAEQVLMVVTLAPLVRDFTPICNDALENWHRTIDPLTTGLLLTDAQGIVRCGVPRDAVGSTFSLSSTLADVRDTNDTVFSNIVLGSITGAELIGVSRRWFPREGGVGMATTGVRVEMLIQPVEAPILRTSVWLADTRGRVIGVQTHRAAIPPPRSLLAETPQGRFLVEVESDGTRLLAAVNRFDANIGVIATRPVAEIEREALYQTMVALLPTIIALAIATIAVILMLRRVVLAPFAALVEGLVERPTGQSVPGQPVQTPYGLPRELAEIWRRVLAYRKAVDEREQQLHAELEMRQQLVREIHHRTKNNLQIVSSLLALQASDTVDPAVADQFGKARARVATLAAVHQRLFGGHVDRIDVKAFLEDLVARVADVNDAEERGISVIVDAEPLEVHMDQGAPLGLIINELLTNSFKYAFAGRPSGRILVTSRHHNGDIDVVVADDGVGAPGAELPSGGLGSTLIMAFAIQLNGRIERRDGPGTIIALSFPIEHD